MSRKVRILMAEDNPADAELVLRELKRAGFAPDWERVETEEDFAAHLHPDLDIILSDYEMPTFTGLRALQVLKESSLAIPFIIISGTIGEEVAVEVMRHGATDYLLKDRLVRLGVAVEHALAQRRMSQERGLAQEELRWKTALLEAQVNSTLDGILVVDHEAKKIIQNRRMVEMFKIPPHIADQKNDAAQLEWVTNMMSAPEDFSAKVRYLYDHPDEVSRDEIELKDGTVLDRYSAPVLGKEGQYYGRTWAFRDITDRKRNAMALLESKRFLQSTLNALTTQIAILNEEGFIIEVNTAWHRFARENDFKGPYRGVGANYLKVCDEAIGDFAQQGSQVAVGVRAVMSGEREEYELEYSSPGPAGVRWFIMRVTRFDAEAPLRVVVAHEEITERKQAEEALRDSERRFRQLAETIHEVFWISDHEKKKVIYVSPAYEVIWGQTCASLLESPQGWSDAIHPEDRERVILAAQTKQIEGSYSEEYRLIRPDGTVRWIHDRAFPVREPDGRVLRIVGMAKDITVEKSLEQQYLRAQRMESIGTLAGGIAHDLNNVLSPIIMSIDLLRLTHQDARTQKVLSTIETSARRGADMVRQILTFARGVEGERVKICPRFIIDDIHHLVQDTFPKNIDFSSEVSLTCPAFLGDHTQVHQVLLNLCVNARDAMPHGGTLRVTADAMEVDESFSAMHHEATPGPYVRIRVTDTGTGMPPSVMERIFDPFFTTKEVGKGTGLGLATTLTIVRSHGGFIGVESESGRGTTFTVCFPATGDGDVVLPLKDDDIQTQGKGELILVVDDESAVRSIMEQTLEAHGYHVLVAADGTQAVALYAQHQDSVAVVVTDMIMPVMDGAATIQVLKRLNPEVRIIAASGYTAKGEIAKAETMGVKHFLGKPYTAQALLGMLRTVLDGSGS